MAMRETITVTTKEQKQVLVLNRVLAGEWTAAQAAEVLACSLRHCRRLLATYREEGVEALVHGNRGRQPKHATPDETRQRIVELATGKYAGLNRTHLTEKLAEAGIQLSARTVRRLLDAAGVAKVRERRPPKHRRRRERRPAAGMLVLVDGSPYRWFGEGHDECSLLAAVDDATGEFLGAVFRPEEDSAGYFLVLGQVLRRYGIPLALYHDGHSIFIDSRPLTLEEELAGKQHAVTQIGRLLEELGIASIRAHSPQAKGRIERRWGTCQDRLVAELRLAGITDPEAANAFLPGFLADYNRRFAHPAAQPPAFRPLPPDLDLNQHLCFKYRAVVAGDNTVRRSPYLVQIPPGRDRRSYARAEVELHLRFDSTITVFYQGQRIALETKAEAERRYAACRRTPAMSAPPAATQGPLPADAATLGPALAPPSANRVAAPDHATARVQRPSPHHAWRRPLTAASAARARTTPPTEGATP